MDAFYACAKSTLPSLKKKGGGENSWSMGADKNFAWEPVHPNFTISVTFSSLETESLRSL